jgi:hypothetical protein
MDRVFLRFRVVLSCRVERLLPTGLFPRQLSEPSGDMVEGFLQCRGWCYGSWKVAKGFEIVVGDEGAVAKEGLGLGHLGCDVVVSDEFGFGLGHRGDGRQRGQGACLVGFNVIVDLVRRAGVGG